MAFDEQIDETVRSIWQSVFGTTLERVPDPPDRVGLGVTGFVTMDGAFDGAVLVQCTHELAQSLTTAMFGSAQTPDRADVQDAIGELANMIAGNLKPLLPGPSGIGLPVVAFGSDYDVQILRTEPVGTVSFHTGGQPILITVVQRSDVEQGDEQA